MGRKKDTLRSKVKRACRNCRYFWDNAKYGECPTGKDRENINKSCKAHKFGDFWV